MIPNFSGIADPLIKLTKKYAKFKWTEECQKAFDYLKESLSVIPLLGYPDVEKNFYILYVDASNYCVGGVLVQPCEEGEQLVPGVPFEKPIYFLSHKLSETQQRWSTIEKEAFAIKYALEKLDHYLLNAKFIIRTDHKPLQYLLESPMQNKKIQQWALAISAYDCTIEHVSGKSNLCADLLSRMYHVDEQADSGPPCRQDINDHMLEVNYINTNRINTKEFISAELPPSEPLKRPVLDSFVMSDEQIKDDELREIKEQLISNKAPKSVYAKYMIIDDILYYITKPDDDPVLRLYIPEHLRLHVVQQYHDDLGHRGIDKVYDLIRQKYYWPNLYKDLYEYVSSCVTCQQHSLKTEQAPVQIPDIPPYPWAKVALDVSGPHRLTASGNRYIITFICLYSGYPEAFATKDKSAETVANLLINEIQPRYSSPNALLVDNGSENVNRVMDETLKELNIKRITTSFYHPQSNGVVERLHKSLNSILAKYLDDHLCQWDAYLNQALAAIRFSISDSSKFSPFALLFNRDPNLPLDNVLRPRRKYLGEEHHLLALERAHEIFTRVHKNLRKAKKRQAKYANKNVKENQELKVGDPVFLKQNRRQNKLQSRWIPYYRVVKVTGPSNYELRSYLDGRIIKAHRNNILRAKIDEWSVPTNKEGRPMRKAAYVVPPSGSESESDSELEPPPVKRRLVRKADKTHEQSRQVRSEMYSDSDNPDDDIPLREIQKSLRREKLKLSDNDPEVTSENNEEKMEVDEIHLPPKLPVVQEKQNISTKASSLEASSDQSEKIRNLLKAVADLV